MIPKVLRPFGFGVIDSEYGDYVAAIRIFDRDENRNPWTQAVFG